MSTKKRDKSNPVTTFIYDVKPSILPPIDEVPNNFTVIIHSNGVHGEIDQPFDWFSDAAAFIAETYRYMFPQSPRIEFSIRDNKRETNPWNTFGKATEEIVRRHGLENGGCLRFGNDVYAKVDGVYQVPPWLKKGLGKIIRQSEPVRESCTNTIAATIRREI